MKHLSFFLIFLTAFAVLILSCKKDFPKKHNKEKNFIVAGDNKQNKLIVFNDSILPGWQEELKLSIDINDNDIADFQFNARCSAYQGGTMNMFESRLEVFNDTEVLVDTSLYSNYVFNKHEITPKMLLENDTIDNDGVWLADFEFNLCYLKDEFIYDDSGEIIDGDRSIFEGWNNLGNRFLGYRYFSENDTIYGWLEFKIEMFYNVFVYQTAHR